MVTAPVRRIDPRWKGVGMDDAVVYELHVGTFTSEGTLRAAIGKLDHLKNLGVTMVELLPLAACPGDRNWGYDGVALFALQAAYGTWADLAAFLEAAHDRGLAVILDVVYNHLGPEGNYTGVFGPFLKKADTPWGEAVNFDEGWNHGVREFFLENARFWLQEVGFDGFRMDAVSLIFDLMPVHILKEMTDLAKQIGRDEGREVVMIAEHLRNNKFVTSEAGFGFDSQWNDDLNHALFATMTRETGRHYQNFGPVEDIVKGLATGFILDGTRLEKHYKYKMGTDGSTTRGTEHVVHIQNHDQVGNRAHGDRLIATYGRDRALLGITAVFASPFVPMLFMGEEFGEQAPFLFFEDFGDPALVEAVRRGRKLAFTSQGEGEPEDAHDRATFLKSKLNWTRPETPKGSEILDYYKTLIALKRTSVLGPRHLDQIRVSGDPATGLVTVAAPRSLTVLNFSPEDRTLPARVRGTVVLASIPQPAPDRIAPWGALVLGV
jgi:maltooligosyltrehalose trehalohydrolase